MNSKDSREKKNKTKSVYKSAVSLFVIILLCLSLTRVVLSNILATSGQRLAAANQKVQIFQEENQKLENEISKLNSLARIENLAKKKGFIKSTNVEILIPAGPIAKR